MVKGSTRERLRIAVVGIVAGGLLLPSAALAAPNSTGTLVGSITCGGQSAPAGVTVTLEGANVSTQSGSGKFVLQGVPAAQAFTVDAVDASDSLVGSRFDVTVAAGETLDIGAIDLPACPAQAVVAPSDVPTADAHDINDAGA